MRIIMAGATGLVGNLALGQLAAQLPATSVTTVSRRPVVQAGENHHAIVAHSRDWADEIAKAAYDVGICCLGTTIKDAGSKEAFASVDLSVVQAFAEACRTSGARQFIMVSSVGADPQSRNFYLSTKGKAEAAVCALGFERVDILRPGLLVGQREGKVRIGETLAIALHPLTDVLTPAVLSRYRSTPALKVAKAILALVGADATGIFKHHNDEMRKVQSIAD